MAGKKRPLVIPGKPRPYVMAHRGNKVVCPENTLASFRQALADGADIIETDLHLTADGVFVCIHDATVDRTTDGTGPVAGMTLPQLKTLSAFYNMPGFEAERVPALSDLAAILPEDIPLALELKTDRFLEKDVCCRLADQLAAMGLRERTIVLSFSLDRLKTVHSVAPDILFGVITLSGVWPDPQAQFLGPLWPILLLNPLYTWLAHRRGQLVAPLDPNPDARLWLYRLLGCDAVLSDDPASTVKALGRRS
ncbi:MAG: glycerophosphodiester phosphodiesterase [Chloroflexota bacterium]|nr:glycerophosphodiester phosphodiesterase [Chloroflexota bacterium]